MANEQKQAQGWRDVQLNANMPLNSLVDFFNVLNQRICNIEDNTIVTVDDQGNKMTLTELYALQAKQQAAQQATPHEGQVPSSERQDPSENN